MENKNETLTEEQLKLIPKELRDSITPEQINSMRQFGEMMQKQSKAEQQKKVKNYARLNRYAKKGGVLFTGSSLMEQFPVCEFSMDDGIDKIIYNRGIGGFTTDDFLEHIDVQLLDLEPSKVFINIGTNDMSPQYGEKWMEHLLSNYRAILTQCKEKLPKTEVYMMAYYPVNASLPDAPFFASAMLAVRSNQNLALVNEKMEALAAEFGYHFINVNDGLTDGDGNLKAEYTIEGIHMYADAYRLVFENLKSYI